MPFDELFLALHGYVASADAPRSSVLETKNITTGTDITSIKLSRAARSQLGDSDQQILQQLSAIASKRARVRSFCETNGRAEAMHQWFASGSTNHNVRSSSQYMTAFTDALTDAYALLYTKQLDAIHDQLNDNHKLGLMHIYTSVLSLEPLLVYTCDFLNFLERTQPCGSQLIKLYCTKFQLCFSTLINVHATLCKQLSCWLAFGRIENDRFGEFFVKELKTNEKHQAESPFNQFEVDPVKCPSYLDDVAVDNLLFIGQASLLFYDKLTPSDRCVRYTNVCTSLQTLLCNNDTQSFVPVRLTDFLRDHRVATARELWDMVLPGGSVQVLCTHVRRIRDVLLLTDGLLWSVFFDTTASLLSSPVTDNSERYLRVAFENAVLATHGATDDSEELIDEFVVIVCAPESSTKHTDVVYNLIDMHLELANSSELRDLALLLPVESIDLLRSLWPFLMRLSSAAKQLRQLWSDTMSERWYRALPRDQQIRVSRARMSLAHFVRCLQQYLLIDVIGGNWTYFESQLLTSCNDFDTVRSLFSACVHAIVSESCLLQPDMRQAFDDLLDAVDRLVLPVAIGGDNHDVNEDSDDDDISNNNKNLTSIVSSHGNTSMSNSTSAALMAAHDAFVKARPRLQYCVSVLRTSVQRNRDSPLARLLLRLDFNGDTWI